MRKSTSPSHATERSLYVRARAISASPPTISSPLSRPPRRDAAPPARIATVRAGRCIAARSALAALRAADHALAPALLTFGQLVALAGERILLLAELDADRRAFELVALAEEVLEIAAVG